ncbi:hypothetical protein WG66_004339 [Moniliophthora roreri]|uniref:Uncharacterized protein n=1 Tax=Moniliophthora roreri TaxID=221103 RepID=A0A0W0FV07_MONRR|nr:hypothetical protein WG66_004339 [Moniliophthora roreri]
MIHPDAHSDDKNSIRGSVVSESIPPSYNSQSSPPTLYSVVEEEKKFVPHLGFRLRHYPLSLFILTAWVAFIAIHIANLEGAVRIAASNASLPWHYRILPDIMSTIFAQGHVPITAMHLSRLAIGSLHFSSTSPRRWAELFWSADKKWQGPLGIITCVIGMAKLRIRVSKTFVLFAITCLLALSTPLVLNRAYPHSPTTVEQLVAIQPSTASPTRMKAVSMYNQLSTGAGQWATGQPISAVYGIGTSIYLPDASITDPDDNLDDMFFAGNAQKMDMSLPGIRLVSGCKVAEDHQKLSANDSLDRFNALCQSKKMPIENGTYSISKPIGLDASIQYRSCFPADIPNVPEAKSTLLTITSTYSYPSSSTMVANIWFRSSQRDGGEDDTDNMDSMVGGIIQCKATMIFGIAQVKGALGTFTSFAEEDLIGDDYISDVPPAHPLWAVLRALSFPQAMGLMQNPFYLQTWLAQMGYMRNSTYRGVSAITQPSLEQISEHLSYGVEYMANAIVILSITSDEWYDAVLHIDSVSRSRAPVYALVAYVLLGIWFALLVGLTARLYRPTFGDGLNSYVVSRMVVDEPSLVEGHGCGDITENKGLRTRFVRVGDGRGSEEKVGRVITGGQTLLSTTRRYV